MKQPCVANRLDAMRSVALAAALLAVTSHEVSAQAYPTKPVRMIVPFPAAGATDILARVVSQKLSESLKQQFVVDNRAGAGGTLGSRLAADAPADGYTILMGTDEHTRDWSEPLQQAAVRRTQRLHCDHGSCDIADHTPRGRERTGELGERADCARQIETRPTQLRFVGRRNPIPSVRRAAQTSRGYRHRAYPLQGHRARLSRHVYRADRNTVRRRSRRTALHQGRPDKSAWRLGKKRSQVLPDVPTIAEAGVSGYDADLWFGLWAPPGLPRDRTHQLHAEVSRLLQSADTKRRFSELGAEGVGRRQKHSAHSLRTKS